MLHLLMLELPHDSPDPDSCKNKHKQASHTSACDESKYRAAASIPPPLGKCALHHEKREVIQAVEKNGS
jgi:hypothetical protein